MVSVLLLSWNHEKYIAQSVRSVISQTYRDLEIIYLDNHSADNSFSIATEILNASGVTYKAFERTRPFGIGQNLNYLLSESSGDFLCLLSGDDWLDPRNIEEKLPPFENPEVALTYSGGYYYYEEQGLYEPVEIPAPGKENFLKALLQRNIISAQGCVLRREALLRTGPWDESLLLEDWDMWIRIARLFEIAKVEKPLFYYRRHTEAVSEDADFMYKARGQVYEKYREMNDQAVQADRNNWETYMDSKVRGAAPLQLTWQVIRKFKPSRFYFVLLLKSLAPASLKKRYFMRSLVKRNAKIIP